MNTSDNSWNALVKFWDKYYLNPFHSTHIELSEWTGDIPLPKEISDFYSTTNFGGYSFEYHFAIPPLSKLKDTQNEYYEILEIEKYGGWSDKWFLIASDELVPIVYDLANGNIFEIRYSDGDLASTLLFDNLKQLIWFWSITDMLDRATLGNDSLLYSADYTELSEYIFPTVFDYAVDKLSPIFKGKDEAIHALNKVGWVRSSNACYASILNSTLEIDNLIKLSNSKESQQDEYDFDIIREQSIFGLGLCENNLAIKFLQDIVQNDIEDDTIKEVAQWSLSIIDRALEH